MRLRSQRFVFSSAACIAFEAIALTLHAQEEKINERVVEIHQRLVAAKEKMFPAGQKAVYQYRVEDAEMTNIDRDLPWFRSCLLPWHLEQLCWMTGDLDRYRVNRVNTLSSAANSDQEFCEEMLEMLVPPSVRTGRENMKSSFYKGIPAAQFRAWPGGGSAPIEFVRIDSERNNIAIRSELLWRCFTCLILSGEPAFPADKPPSGQSVTALVQRYISLPPKPAADWPGWEGATYDVKVIKMIDGITFAILYEDRYGKAKTPLSNKASYQTDESVLWCHRVPLITDGSFIYTASTPWSPGRMPHVTALAERYSNW